MLYKVLIVDDEPLLRNTIRSILPWEKYSFTVCGEASDGNSALRLLDSLTPDIVFTDIVMPDMDGLELLKNIKLRFPRTNVIMLSSYDDFCYVRKALQFGATDYILKPTLEAEQLLGLLKRLFPSQSVESVSDTALPHLNAMFDGIIPPEVIFGGSSVTVAAILTEKMNVHTQIEAIEALKALLEETRHHQITRSDAEFFFIPTESVSGRIKEFFTVGGVTGMVIYGIRDRNQLTELCSSFEYLKAFPFFMPFCHVLQSDIRDLLPFRRQTISDPDEDNLTALSNLMLFLQNVSFRDRVMPRQLKLKAETVLYRYISKESDSWQDLQLLEQITFAENIYELQEAYSSIYNGIIEQRKKRNCDSSLMDHIIEYVEKNYNRNISLNDVAAELHFNYSYLSHYFNTQSSINFKEYLNNIRIGKAKRLLIECDLSISDICFQTGFADPAYFSRVFRKITGLTPTDYKQSYHTSLPERNEIL